MITRADDALLYLEARRDEGGPDLIVLDLNLPGMSGWELLDVLEDWEQLPAIAILTTSLDPKHEERAQAHPRIHSFCRKPLTQESLQRICEEVLAARAAQRA